ncbi:uncharacterized protein TNCV_3153021 [Trichonephila clavipes]|nr:uncharacterized protein TNCV_3153021 [Trichonephila clavipes]
MIDPDYTPSCPTRSLWQRVEAAWSAAPQEHIQSLFESMPRRVAMGLGSSPGEEMDVCKCILPLRYGGAPNSRRAASPLVWLVEGEDRWKAPGHPSSKLGWNRAKSFCHLPSAQS